MVGKGIVLSFNHGVEDLRFRFVPRRHPCCRYIHFSTVTTLINQMDLSEHKLRTTLFLNFPYQIKLLFEYVIYVCFFFVVAI